MMESTSSLVGQTLGQYRIIEQIGEGGMATVFKAYQPGLNRDVALKVLPPHFAKQAGFTERFGREAQAIGNLHHPNILPVYDFGQEKGYSYIAMRYISDARTLTDEMKSPLKTERIVELISQVAGALDQAHTAGIIHRDVKPSNILLDGQWALLSDFGLAKMVEIPSELTGSGVGMGTPAYMSPEQGMGKKVDHRTDIYALGIILYEMLTGQVPHRAETPIATVLKRINEPLPLPRRLNPNIPEAVERVLLKALAPEPAHRFDSAGEMAAALKVAFGPQPEEVTAGVGPGEGLQPQTASPPAEPTRLSDKPVPKAVPGKSTLRSRPVLFGAAGLFLLLVLAGIFMVRQSSHKEARLSQIAVTANLEKAAPSTEESSSASALESTPTSIATPPPTDSPTSTATTAPTASPTLAATNTPVATDTPVPATVTPPPVVAQALTGQEIHDLALAEAHQWQADAVLSEISTTGLGPLDEEGKSDSWTLKFWSPSTKGFNSMMYMDGALTSTPSDLPVPEAVVAKDVILDTKQLYDLAEAAGAAEFTAEGYRPMASLTPFPLDKSRLTWYLNYQGGDYRVVYTVIIDAVTGEVMQAIGTE